MKSFLISVAAIALLAGPALAQDHREHRGGPPGGQGQAPAAAPAAPAAAVAAPAPAQPAPQANPAPGQRGNFGRRGFNGNGNAAPQAAAQPAPQAAPQAAPNNPGRGNFDRRDFSRGDNRPDFNRGDYNRPGFNGRPGGPRPDWNNYHRSFRAPHRYRAPQPYHRPPGFTYRRWSYGQFLPSIFWGRDYWLDDWNDFGLMNPPPGTIWVRYGDDALLIDRYTGEVIQVEYDIFY